MTRRRKPNNNANRYRRLVNNLLQQSPVAVYNLDPGATLGFVELKTARRVRPAGTLADAMFALRHRWVIYIAAFHRQADGREYMKSVEIAPDGAYYTTELEDVLREHYTALIDGCNPAHLIASGWLANPVARSLTEAEAARLFRAVGAWELPEQWGPRE